MRDASSNIAWLRHSTGSTSMISGARFFLAAICMAAAGSVHAAQWGLAELMDRLRSVSSADADFVERKYLVSLDRPLDASGTLVYRAPSHLEKRTLRPK